MRTGREHKAAAPLGFRSEEATCRAFVLGATSSRTLGTSAHLGAELALRCSTTRETEVEICGRK